MKTRHLSSLCALVLLATLSGCSPTPAPSASSSATASASESASSFPTPEATPSSTPRLENREEIPSRKASLTQGKEDANHAPVFHDLRVGEHETFYRVVVEFTGSDDVGWQGGWTTSPATQGKGDPIDLGTPIYLELSLEGGAMPVSEELQKDYYKGERTKEVGPIRVREDGSFEANTHIVIGMDHKREVTLSALSTPSRVVVDIAK